MTPRPPTSTLFPYTTLFRSVATGGRDHVAGEIVERRRELFAPRQPGDRRAKRDRKSTRLNSSHRCISYAVFCLKKKKREHVGKGEKERRGEGGRWPGRGMRS